MKQLFALRLAIWNMATFIGWRDYNESSSPSSCEFLLFKSEDEAKEYASKLYFDSDIYNDVTLHTMSLTDKEIVELSGLESIGDFEDAMKAGLYPPEKSSWWSDTKPYGYDERVAIAKHIVENGEELYEVDCPNYDIDKSIEGSIIVIWEWHRYVGYARNFVELRYAYDGETEALLTKEDSTSGNKVDIVLTKEEAENCEDLENELIDRLLADDAWKWTRESAVNRGIDDFIS